MTADIRNNNNQKTSSNGNHKWLRTAVQLLFLAFVIFVGFQFRNFVNLIAAPEGNALAHRPPSVEGFLPVSSLVSLLYYVRTGIAVKVHPAGLVIFSLTIGTALLIRRGFCGWICPIGTISELAQKAGRKFFGRNLKIPKWLDIPLMSLKFLLMIFFLYNILRIPTVGMKGFLNGQYNKISDVKMYLFFANISTLALLIITTLFVSLIFIKHFWCRYLCPYGALLGFMSLSSPIAVRRDEHKCISCGKCARACPNSVGVNKEIRVNSAECMACYSCVDECPEPGALNMVVALPIFRLPKIAYAIILIGAFILFTQLASYFGYWQTNISNSQYRELFKIRNEIAHPAPASDTRQNISPDNSGF